MTKNKIVQFETIPQLKLGFAGIGLDEVNIINKYIDDNTERLPDLSSQLVGQIKQDEKSKQLEFDLNDTVPKQLSKFFIMCAKEYAAEHPVSDRVKEIIGPKEEYVVKKMWSIHSYAGDYNPLHEHGTVSGRGVSMIVFLKLPPQISNLAENMKGEIGVQHGNSGSTDGLTQFVWGGDSMYDIHMLGGAGAAEHMYDIPRFKHPSFAYAHPEVGKVVIFPIWLLHQVAPFFGKGERRTMSCNIDIINSHV